MQATAEKMILPADVTFRNSHVVPFQRWYPYIEGYSMAFVQKLIADYCVNPSLVYEPFAGTGTTLFAADTMGCDTIYSEVNPLLRFLIATKLDAMSRSRSEREQLAIQCRDIAATIISQARKQEPSRKLAEAYIRVFGSSEYFPKEEYLLILRLKTYIEKVMLYDSLLRNLLTTAVLASILPVSYLKKQGDVRFKTEKELLQMQCIEDVLPQKIREIADDLESYEFYARRTHRLVTPNAKMIGRVATDTISAVITSPPYLNGTNYFRNTKLELWFLGVLSNKQELRAYRNEALTSGINDVLLKEPMKQTECESPLLEQTMEELVVKAYDARIPRMAHCYFSEMSELFTGLRSHLRNGADLLIDLGDSIFSGVHIRTDYILAEVLQSLGYEYRDRVVLRQRRSRGGGLLSQVLLVLRYHQ